MKYILAGMMIAATAGAASAQTSVTVRPYGSATGSSGYVGPYGPGLPGVYMFRGGVAPGTPTLASGGVMVPTKQRIENEQTYSQSKLPVLDGWRANLSDGIPF